MGPEWSWLPGETTLTVIYAEWMLCYQIESLADMVVYRWPDRDTNGEQSTKWDGSVVAHSSVPYIQTTKSKALFYPLRYRVPTLLSPVTRVTTGSNFQHLARSPSRMGFPHYAFV